MNAIEETFTKSGFRLRNLGIAFGSALLIIVIVLTADILIDQLSRLGGTVKSFLISCSYLLFPVSVSLAAIVLVFRCRDENAVSRIALALVAISFMSRIVWISVFDSYQVNDFGYYLQCAADVARTGSPVQSSFCEDVYWKRTVFYTYPLVLLFGQSLLAVKLANVLLVALTSWIFYRTCRINFSARTAAIALALFIWHPDIWYSITLASHDVPGLFWLAIFYYLCARLPRRLGSAAARWPELIATSLCLGLTIFLLDFSRSYQYGAIVALTLFALVHCGNALFARSAEGEEAGSAVSQPSRDIPRGMRIRRAAILAGFVLVLPLGVYRLAGAGFWTAWHLEPGRGNTGLTCYLSVMDVLGTTDYEEINNWYDRQCSMISGREKTVFAIRKVLHDVTHDPRQFFRHIERKNLVLGRSDDYIEWATHPEHEIWDTSYNQVKRINRSHWTEQIRAISISQIIVLTLVLWRLLLYPRLKFRQEELIPIAFSAVYYLLFLILVESQPRYDVFLIFPFSWMAAQAVEDLHRRIAAEPVPVSRGVPHSRARCYLGGAAVLALLVGAYWGAAVLLADSSLTLRDQSGFAQVPRDKVAAEVRRLPQVEPIFIRNNHKQLMLAYPPGIAIEPDSIIAVQRTFTIRERASHHLRFFISNYSVREEPFDKMITWEDVDLEYLISVNGRTIAAGRINDFTDNRYFSLPARNGLALSPGTTIQLIIRNREKIEIVEPTRGPIMSLEYIDLQ